MTKEEIDIIEKWVKEFSYFKFDENPPLTDFFKGTRQVILEMKHRLREIKINNATKA